MPRICLGASNCLWRANCGQHNWASTSRTGRLGPERANINTCRLEIDVLAFLFIGYRVASGQRFLPECRGRPIGSTSPTGGQAG